MGLRRKTRWLMFGGLVVAFLASGLAGFAYWKSRPDYLFRSAQGYFTQGENALRRDDSSEALRAYEYADQQLRRLLQEDKEPRYPGGLMLRHQVLTRLAELYAREESGQGISSPERRSVVVSQAALQCVLRAASDPQDLDAHALLVAHFTNEDQLSRAEPYASGLLQTCPSSSAGTPLDRACADAHYVLAWSALHAKPPDCEGAIKHVRATAPSWRMAGLEASALRLLAERPTQKSDSTAGQVIRQALDTCVERWLEKAGREAGSMSRLSLAEVRGLLDLLLLGVIRAAKPSQLLERANLVDSIAERLTAGERPSQSVLREVAEHLADLRDELRRSGHARGLAPEVRSTLEARTEKASLRTVDANTYLPPLLCLRLAAASGSSERGNAALSFAEKGLQAIALAAPADRDEKSRRTELALHAEMARALLRKGREQEAELHLVPLRRDSTSFASIAHLLQGSAALRSGRLQEAQSEFQKVEGLLSLEDDFRARLGLAEASMGLGQWDRASGILKKLRSQLQRNDLLPPDRKAPMQESLRTNLYLSLFRCHLALDQLDKALPFLEMLPAKPEGVTARFRLIEYYLAAGQARQASGQIAAAAESFTAASRELRTARQVAPDDNRLLSADVGWLIRSSETLPGTISVADAPSAESVSQVKQRLAAARPGDELRLPGRSVALNAQERSQLLDYLDGLIAQLRGQYRTAVRSFEQSLTCTPLQGPSERGLLVNLLNLSAQETPAAVRDLAQQLLQRHPGEPVLLFVLAASALQLGEMKGEHGAEETLKTLAESLRRQNRDPALGLCLQGWGWLVAGRPDLARRELDLALRENPRHVPSLWLAAQASQAAEDWSACVQFAGFLHHLEPGLAEPLLWRAQAFDRLGNSRAARRDYEVLLQQHPDVSVAYSGLSALLEKEGDYGSALRIAERWRERMPNEPGALQAQVRLLARNGQLEQAEQRGRQVQGGQILAVARGLFEAGVMSRAEAWAQRALALAEQSKPLDEAGVVAARLLLGDICLAQLDRETSQARRNLVDRAVTQFEAVLKQNPNQWIAANNLAWLLDRERGEPENAYKVLVRARRGGPKDQLLDGDRLPVEWLMTAGIVYCDARHFQDAVTLLKEGIRRYSNDPRLHLRLGRAYVGLRKSAEAQTTLNTAIRLATSRADSAEDRDQRSLWQAIAEEARHDLRSLSGQASAPSLSSNSPPSRPATPGGK